MDRYWTRRDEPDTLGSLTYYITTGPDRRARWLEARVRSSGEDVHAHESSRPAVAMLGADRTEDPRKKGADNTFARKREDEAIKLFLAHRTTEWSLKDIRDIIVLPKYM